MIDAHEHYRAVAISQMRQQMRYGVEQYREDREMAFALALMMGVEGYKEHLELLLDRCFMRIEAYLANNPGVA